MHKLLKLLSGSGPSPTLGPGKVTVFSSYCGGSWRTTALLNVAFALERLGKSVLVLDADYRSGDARSRLAPEQGDEVYDGFCIEAALSEKKRLGARWRVNAHVARASSRVFVLGFRPPTNFDDAQARVEASESLVACVDEVLRQVAAAYDFVLVDTPSGDDSVTRAFVLQAHQVVFMVNQNPTNLHCGLALLKTLLQQARKKERGFDFFPLAVGGNSGAEYLADGAWKRGTAEGSGRTYKGLGYGPVLEQWVAQNYDGRQLKYQQLWAVPDIPFFSFHLRDFPGQEKTYDGTNPGYYYELMATQLLGLPLKG